MDFSTLVSMLYQEDYKCISSSGTATDIFTWKEYRPLTEIKTGIVYLCEASQLPDSIPEASCFLCSGTSSKVGSDLAFKNSDIIIVNEDLESLETKVDYYLNLDHKLQSDKQLLFNAMNTDKGLQNLVDTAYTLFKSPILVVDSAFKILAEQIGDNEYLSQIKSWQEMGHYTDTNIQSLKQQRVYERARERGYPLLTSKSEKTNKSWLITLVYASSIEIAQLSIMEYNHEFNYYDFELAHYLSKLISLELQKDDLYKHNQMFSHSALIADLLAGRITNDTAIVRSKQLNWVLSDHMYLLSISSQFYDFSDQKAKFICTHLQELIPNSRWMITENEIIFLLVEKEPDKKESIWANLHEYLEVNKLTASVSDYFSNLIDIKWKHVQCNVALRIGMRLDPEKCLYFYKDYYLHHVCFLALEKYPMQVFYHPGVREMHKYDILHNTKLLESVKTYLIYSDSPTSAAAKLFIHKNTLFYRLNKAKELFGLDYNNSFERIRILLTILSIDLATWERFS